MGTRVLLGEGPILRAVAGRVDGPVHVVTGDDAVARTARERGLPTTEGDPTVAGTLPDLAGVTSAFVATDVPGRAAATAGAARGAFPDATVVACVSGPADGSRPDLEGVADRVVDPGRAVADFLLDRLGAHRSRIQRLGRTLRALEDIAVVTHDNPDPDAIASGIALQRIAEAVGCEASVVHYGDISHQENRAFLNLLEFGLTRLEAGDQPDADGIALIDHSRPGVNDGLDPGTPVDVVIDHHPPREPVDAGFVDIRSDVGATSTLLVGYLDGFGIGMATDVATGLLFGIRTDTREFTREVSPADFEAAARLVPGADLSTLDRIESPSISADTFETIAAAISNRCQEGPVLFSGVGRLSDRDALAQAADRLVQLETVSTAIVYGVADGTIYVSARSRDADLDVGELLRDAFGRIGSAGGHADMAGAQIALGVLDTVEDREESLFEIVDTVLSSRVLEALDTHQQPIDAPYTTGTAVADTFVPPDAPTDGDGIWIGSDPAGGTDAEEGDPGEPDDARDAPAGDDR